MCMDRLSQLGLMMLLIGYVSSDEGYSVLLGKYVLLEMFIKRKRNSRPVEVFTGRDSQVDPCLLARTNNENII